MKTAITITVLLMALGAVAQQTNVIFGNVGDYGLVPQPDVTATATLLRPNPRQVGNVQMRVDPVAVYTDAAGDYSFTNFQYGFYQLDISGQGTVFRFNVWTNTLGRVAIGSLITNVATLPPQPGTNYYTQAQVDALIASVLLADDKVFSVATQSSAMPSIRPPAVCYTFRGGFFVKTNATFDTNGWNQIISDRP